MRSPYRRYDPRLKNLVAKSGNIDLFAIKGIPKSSLRQWVNNGPQEIVTLPELELGAQALVRGNLILRTIAQIDIEFSNSMIEMLFYRLKHLYLFTIPLTNFSALENGVDFYFTESNTTIPHAALKGATPEEVVTGKWTDAHVEEMRARVDQVRQRRIETHQSMRCAPCLA